MVNVKRKKGITEIQIGSIKLKTTLIDRHRFNDLRKKEVVTPNDIILAMRKHLKRE